MYAEPQTLHLLLDKLADSVISYLNAQIKAGAQAVMVFDTWGGVLTPRDYRDFSLQYMHKIVDGLIREHDGRRVPVTLFTKNGGQWLEQIAATGCDALGLTGPPTSPTPSAGSATRWRCRATWTLHALRQPGPHP